MATLPAMGTINGRDSMGSLYRQMDFLCYSIHQRGRKRYRNRYQGCYNRVVRSTGVINDSQQTVTHRACCGKEGHDEPLNSQGCADRCIDIGRDIMDQKEGEERKKRKRKFFGKHGHCGRKQMGKNEPQNRHFPGQMFQFFPATKNQTRNSAPLRKPKSCRQRPPRAFGLISQQGRHIRLL